MDKQAAPMSALKAAWMEFDGLQPAGFSFITSRFAIFKIVRKTVDNLCANLLDVADITMALVRCCRCNRFAHRLSTRVVSFKGRPGLELQNK